jgi:hypothetical protein
MDNPTSTRPDGEEPDEWAERMVVRLEGLPEGARRRVRRLIDAVARSDDDGAEALALSRRYLDGELTDDEFDEVLETLL